MVVDHVEDDLDPSAMQRFDHVAKFVQRARGVPAGAVAVVRGEKRKRLVAPIVAEPRRTVVLIEREDR
jgi:hypothetical protein